MLRYSQQKTLRIWKIILSWIKKNSNINGFLIISSGENTQRPFVFICAIYVFLPVVPSTSATCSCVASITTIRIMMRRNTTCVDFMTFIMWCLLWLPTADDGAGARWWWWWGGLWFRWEIVLKIEIFHCIPVIFIAMSMKRVQYLAKGFWE